MLGQHKLTNMDRDKLTGRAAKRTRAVHDAVCQCGACYALYVYRDGFSTFLCYR